jgi:NTP pyrophosphatase (non-canonical NTP hydrolase)
MSNIQQAAVINQFASKVYEQARKSGFWNDAEQPSYATLRLASIADEIDRIAQEIERIRKDSYDAEHDTYIRSLYNEVPNRKIKVLSKLSLIASEVGEAIEAIHEGSSPDALAEELADVIIRCLDLAEYEGLNIGLALITKHTKNATRPIMHGKQA